MSGAYKALNRLAKWRAHFAGWQLGTRLDTDAEGCAVRDHRETTLMLRAEVSALVTLLVTKKVITVEEWDSALETEAMLLERDLEKRWPGVRATEHGLAMDLDTIQRAAWMKGWRP